MDDFLRRATLYDLYGSLLTDKQRRVYAERYRHDLSLAEIAEQEGVSRQAASDMLNRVSRLLERYESRLGLLAERERLNRDVRVAVAFARRLSEKRDVTKPDWEELTQMILSVSRE